MTQQLPILIIGAGPVGLSLATALAKQGINVHVFEQDAELNSEIRASTFHPRTLELLNEWDVVDPILAAGYTVDRLMYWERSSRELIAQFNYSLISDDTKFPFRLQCPQHVATRVLKPLLEQSPNATVHMGHKLVGFKDYGEYVEAEFETVNGRSTHQGLYLCAADGSRSTVRKQLDLTFTGKTYEDRFLLIGTDLDLSPLYSGIGPVNYLFDPKEWVIILQLPDLVRVVFRLRDDEDEAKATTEAALRARLWGFLQEEIPFNILTTQVYRVHQRVAETFRVGRILLLGDAAHINNPAGGMGMNSGIQDAANLAEKITAVLHQNASDSLFDQYSEERRAAALENVQSYSDKNYNDMAATDETYRHQRNEQLKTQAADPAQARAYLLKASMLDDRI